jgi:hypothetical protein
VSLKTINKLKLIRFGSTFLKGGIISEVKKACKIKKIEIKE